ncbi:MAG: 2-hydroxyacid dehydrogenase [Clostridia bacterium]|nr:2-hydroxyacid dehydrogenase [Clostridia bacterium]
MKIAFFDAKPYDKDSFEKYINNTEISIKYFDTKLNEDTVELANGYEGVCAFVNDDINKNVIDALCSYGIKILVMRCAGYNNVDIKYAKGKIRVARVPSYSPYSIAEHAMAMLLCSVRKIHRAYIRTKDFNFSLNGLTGFDLNGKTVGIVGTGRIGKAFLDLCKGFNMNILAYDKICTYTDFVRYVPLDEIFAKSDIISLHCPLNDETYHLINENAISKMKKGVILINTSRGALIDAEALLEGIKSRKIGGACLDVYEEESDFFFEDLSGHIIKDDILARLISMPNVIVTSHQAYLTSEALENIARTTVENIIALKSSQGYENEILV